MNAGTKLWYRNQFVTIGVFQWISRKSGEKMLTKSELPPCSVATTIQLIGNKWKLFIMRNLLGGTQRFGELRKTIPGISQKVLTENLRSMEDDGIVIRTVFAEVPPRVEYRLSPVGESMRPIIAAMEKWGTKYKERRDGKDYCAGTKN